MNKGLLGVSGASVSPESLVGKSVPQSDSQRSPCVTDEHHEQVMLLSKPSVSGIRKTSWSEAQDV